MLLQWLFSGCPFLHPLPTSFHGSMRAMSAIQRSSFLNLQDAYPHRTQTWNVDRKIGALARKIGGGKRRRPPLLLAPAISPTPSLAIPEPASEPSSFFQENYIILKELGQGTYSRVFLCKDPTDKLVAVKEYRLEHP